MPSVSHTVGVSYPVVTLPEIAPVLTVLQETGAHTAALLGSSVAQNVVWQLPAMQRPATDVH